MPAEVFTSIVDTYKAGVRIGLSGTLGRKDGRDVLITNYISPTILVAKQDNVMIPEINVINTGMKIPFAHSWAHKVSLLIRDTKYLNMLLHITFAALEKGHKILIPSDRLDLLHILHKEIGENSILITSAEGDRTDLTSKLADDFDVILGSRSIFQEGISINNLSALIIATPLNNKFVLEQLVGRIIRKYDGKLTPEVFDLAFHCVTGINQFRTRRHFYESAGYKVNYYRYG
jgi:superfamily II DNA or RNA helicase